MRSLPTATTWIALIVGVLMGCAGVKMPGSAPSPQSGSQTQPPAPAMCRLPAPKAIQEQRDVAYGSDPAQRLDVAWPSSGVRVPLVVLIHGGGWMGGDKSELADMMRNIAGLGYAVASMDYRLARNGTNQFPTAVQDVRCGSASLASNASRFSIDPARMVVFGFSAGGHLASLLGTAWNDIPLDPVSCHARGPSPRPRGVIAMAPPLDLRDLSLFGDNPTMDPKNTVVNFLGSRPSQDPAKAALASPITHVDAASPPFLLFHGVRDDVVLIEQSKRMQKALRDKGVSATLVELPIGHHAPDHGSRAEQTFVCTAVEFLRTVLQP